MLIQEEKTGNGKKAEMGDVVTFDWQCFLPDGTLACCGKKCQTVLGDGAEPPAVELALRYLNPGGMAKVRSSHRFAFHCLGREPSEGKNETKVEPEQDVVFCLSVLNCQSRPDVTAVAEVRKASGNFYFNRGSYDKAALCYDKAVQCLNTHTSDEMEKKFLVDCGNNLAAARLKLGKLPGAMEAVVNVLSLQPDNLKALYRAGIIATLQDKFEEASVALSQAAAVREDDCDVRRAQANLLARKRIYNRAKEGMERRMGKSLINDSQLEKRDERQVSIEPDTLTKCRVGLKLHQKSIFLIVAAVAVSVVAILISALSIGGKMTW